MLFRGFQKCENEAPGQKMPFMDGHSKQRCTIDLNPCLNCGACCAFYRVTFYWAETDEFTPGGVPSEMTVRINDFRIAMKGTECFPSRCNGLAGVIGENVHCTLYENRSSTCRELEPSWLNNQPNIRCDKARLAWGLKPLSPDVWFGPGHLPRAA